MVSRWDIEHVGEEESGRRVARGCVHLEGKTTKGVMFGECIRCFWVSHVPLLKVRINYCLL